ncbi:hypothetical protein CPB85DRAFT_1265650 [Mucidula mucida]|nr:hypothetical protein CPB85DRAFT_1265650 [Mucidula mucida]
MSLRTALRLGASSGAIRLRSPCSPLSWRLWSRLLATHAHDNFCEQRIEEFAAVYRKSATKRDDIHNHYPSLVSTVKWSLSNDPKLTVTSPPESYTQQLNAMLEVLALSASPTDLKLIDKLLEDMPVVFLMHPNTETHNLILRALIKANKIPTAVNWISNIAKKPGDVFPTLFQYHMILEACMGKETPNYLLSIIRKMRSSGCPPTQETYAFVIRALWEQHDNATAYRTRPSLLTFRSLIKDMTEDGLSGQYEIADMLYDGYASRGFMSDAATILQDYMASGEENVVVEEQQRFLELCSQLSEAAQKGGVHSALNLFVQLRPGDWMSETSADWQVKVPARRMLRAILRKSSSVADLTRAEEVTGIKASLFHWTDLITNAVRRANVSGAIEIYETAKAAGITPDAPMVGPIIQALCYKHEEASYLSALAIYNELKVSQPLVGYREKDSRMDRSKGPDLNVYQNLMRGLSHVAASLPNAMELLEQLTSDMKARDIPLFTVSGAKIVILMHQTSSEDQAFAIYEKYKKDLDSPGYIEVLNGFSSLTYGKRVHNPSLVRYFQIANDMKRAGLPPMSDRVFTTLLSTYSKIVTQLRKNGQDAHDYLRSIQTSVRRIHDLITLEAALSPSAVMWNTVMDLYQRLGCYGDAYRVWEQMLFSGRYDEASVSIIFDVCAFSGSSYSLRQALSRLEADKYKLNKRNWDSLVEAYLRLGMPNEAAKAVCLEMPKNDVQPDQTTVRTLLNLASEDKDLFNAIQQRVEKYLPGEWGKLPAKFREPMV